MKKDNRQSNEVFTIALQWIWWLLKLLFISIYVVGIALEYALKAINYLLKNLITYEDK